MSTQKTRANTKPLRAKPPGRKPGEAPAAFLAAAKRTAFQSGAAWPGNGARRCHAIRKTGEQCRGVALRGMRVCQVHGGLSAKARRGEYVSKRKRAAPQAPPAPDALRAMPVYVRAGQRERVALAVAYAQREQAPDAWRALVRSLAAPRTGGA